MKEKFDLMKIAITIFLTKNRLCISFLRRVSWKCPHKKRWNHRLLRRRWTLVRSACFNAVKIVAKWFRTKQEVCGSWQPLKRKLKIISSEKRGIVSVGEYDLVSEYGQCKPTKIEHTEPRSYYSLDFPGTFADFTDGLFLQALIEAP